MARPRQYATDAERQRAFRERQEQAFARVDRRVLDRLHPRLDQLQEALRVAAAAGDEMAPACHAAGIDTMLERLTDHFRRRARPRDPLTAEGSRGAAGPGPERRK